MTAAGSIQDDASLNTRRLALEELREANAFALKSRELDLAESDAARMGGRLRALLVPLVSATLGAAASLGAAALAGLFSVQERTVEVDAEAELEAQKFSYQLISTALAETEPRDRALRLQFLVDIGLLDNLNHDQVRSYAQAERDRLQGGAKGESFLPYYPSMANLETLAGGPLIATTWPDLVPLRAALRDFADCDIPMDGMPGPKMRACLKSYLGEEATEDHINQALYSAHFVSQWISDGAPPADWRAILEYDSHLRNQRQELLSNFMKSVHDMSMTPIRNIR